MKLFKNKRGIELSVNFIVMLILGIAMFAGGLVFVSKFFGHAEKVRGSLDAQTEKQLEKLLDSGSPVVMPISNKEIFRNKYDTFALGVLARFNGEYEVTISSTGNAFRTDKSAISATAGDWLDMTVTKQTLKRNDKGKFLIGVEVPKTAEKGTYIFEAVVHYNGDPGADPPVPGISEPYDNPLQFIVKVP